MAEVQGETDGRFAGVRAALEHNLAAGKEIGASVAVDWGGQTVVDLWGGFQDEARTTPWTADTIVSVWSTTKLVISLAALLLVERGQLDVDAPVAEYWPEFAANGKAGVRVRHVLGHTSGVSGWDPPAAFEDLSDWDAATARLADQRPWWEPGTASGYHLQTYGNLLGELVRRTTGRPFDRFIAEEITGPLAADFQIGARETDWGRVAEMIPAAEPLPFEPASLDPASPMARTLMSAVDPALPNTPAWRRADRATNGGHGNARAVMRALRAVALGGTAGGVHLLSPKTVDLIFEEQADGTDLVLGIPLRWGVGFALPNRATLPYLPDGRVCFWGGYGGSLVVMDRDRQLTIAYAMNKLAPDFIGSDRARAYVEAVYDAVRR